MGCAPSTAKVAVCTGEVTNPHDGAVGVVTATVPGTIDNSKKPDSLKLHHDVHGLLVKNRTTIKGRPQVRHYEISAAGFSAGEKMRVTLSGPGT